VVHDAVPWDFSHGHAIGADDWSLFRVPVPKRDNGHEQVEQGSNATHGLFVVPVDPVHATALLALAASPPAKGDDVQHKVHQRQKEFDHSSSLLKLFDIRT
jgi:hypothetical protein